MENQVRIFESIDELADYFGNMLVESINKIPIDAFFTIALSGGSTPKKVFEFLASNYKDKIDWQKVLVFWGDERCVNPESDESNYKMFEESILVKVSIPPDNIFRIKGEENPMEEAVRYSEIIRKHVPQFHNAPQFDFMMLGLGEDGHTASIFPDNLQLFESEIFCEVAINPYTKQQRITVTGKVINQSKTIVFIATGESKSEMVARIIERKNGCEFLPASKIKPENGELIWLLDKPAANGLEIY
jgi:6-phosphogluconolactonase